MKFVVILVVGLTCGAAMTWASHFALNETTNGCAQNLVFVLNLPAVLLAMLISGGRSACAGPQEWAVDVSIFLQWTVIGSGVTWLTTVVIAERAKKRGTPAKP